MPGSTSCSTTACSTKFCWRLHLVSAPVVWLSTDTAMYIGIVYSYLPFMILPLYATLAKMQPSLLEAAADLGASPLRAFWLVTLPLSLPGVGAGMLLCFIPIVGEFVIPDLAGRLGSMMIGQTLWLEFFTNKDWPVAVGAGGRAAGRAGAAAADLRPAAAPPARGPVDGRGRSTLSPFNLVSLALGLAFLYLPIVILVIYSFNDSRLVTVWGGWSLRWYHEFFNDQRDARRGLDEPARGAGLGDGRRRCSARWRRWRCRAAGASAAARCSPACSMRRW